jgi:hypothetical protein
MKTIMQITIISLLALIPVMIHGQNSFSAEMLNVRRGTESIYQLQSMGEKYRYDFDESGMKGIVIVDQKKGETAILMPDEKFVHYTDIHSQTSLMNDPYQAFIYSKSRYDEKKLGKEKIAGYDCIKSELYASGQLVYTAWYSEELDFLVKLVNEMADNTYMELREIEKGKISEEIFSVPEDYTEVDRKMRPIIPEPPAPDSWKEIKSSIPLKGEYKRGDVILFKVPESRNYKFILNNNIDRPAKIIRIGMRDGKELPDNEQGPVSYRTRRLHAGESFSNVYSWEEGDEKLIQVHEGVINIEILPENR